MAFVKRTWLARIGTGLNKFIIGEKDANDKQTLVNSPDSVSQQGDVISADNLNDLEDRIDNEFTSQSTRINAKQDTLTFDNVPTSGSNNPVKSGGVYTSVHNLEVDVGSMKLTKVWQNPSPNTSFAQQEFVLEPYNGTAYEYVVEFRYENVGSTSYTTEFRHLKMYNPVSGYTACSIMNFRHTAPDVACFLKSRQISFKTSNNNLYVKIGDCYQVGISTSSVTMSTTNDNLVPIAIYKVGSGIYSN